MVATENVSPLLANGSPGTLITQQIFHLNYATVLLFSVTSSLFLANPCVIIELANSTCEIYGPPLERGNTVTSSRSFY